MKFSTTGFNQSDSSNSANHHTPVNQASQVNQSHHMHHAHPIHQGNLGHQNHGVQQNSQSFHGQQVIQSSSHTPAPLSSVEDLARIFNTAVVTTRATQKIQDVSHLLEKLIETPAFRVILLAIRQHARNLEVSEKQAAEQIIETFRKLDELWSHYLFQEGMSRLKGR